MKALVTGANGLIGANLLRELLRDGHEAVGLVRPTADVSHIERLPVRRAIGDVLDVSSVTTASAGCDVIFHTAVHFSYWGHSPDDLARTAVEGSRNVLAAARAASVDRVVMTSSSVTLGASYAPEIRDEGFVADDDADEPAYVRAKIAQERAAIAEAKRLGLALIIACPTMSVGPYGAALGPSNGVITSYLADPLRLTWAGGCNIAAVRDVARGHILLAERGAAGERYVLGSENLAWRDIHERIAVLSGVAPPGATASATTCYWVAIGEELRARVSGRAPLATRSQARMIGRYYWYSHDRAAALGYTPRPAVEALAEAIAWLAASSHVAGATRRTMRLARPVHTARAAAADAERMLIA